MLETLTNWMCGHPLQAVACLVGMGIAIGLLAIPGLHEIAHRHGHPRC